MVIGLLFGPRFPCKSTLANTAASAQSTPTPANSEHPIVTSNGLVIEWMHHWLDSLLELPHFSWLATTLAPKIAAKTVHLF